MSFNKFMHPRNPYRVPPAFKEVAIEYPKFRKHLYQDLSGKLKYNFKDPNALRVFTKTLLHRDFGLDINIPASRLVPTLPLRLNYILWIEDLLELNQIQIPVHGIDLGTGASCIYPLLGHKMNSWQMLALDTDPLSCDCAQKNVEQNGLEDFIEVKNTSSSPYCLEPFLEPNISYNFTMCNPPFYDSSYDMMQGSKQKEVPMVSSPRKRLAGVVTEKNGRHPPSNGHTGSEAELVAPGGEVAFVKNFVEANVHLSQIKIFTTMLGHKTSFTAMKQFLSEHPSVKKISTTEFCQGNTMRWGIAWTATEGIQLRDELPRKVDGSSKSKPLVCVLEADSVNDVLARITTLCDTLKIIYKVLKKCPKRCKLNLAAQENTWSKQRRLKRQKLKENLDSELPILQENLSCDSPVKDENYKLSNLQENSSRNSLVKKEESNSIEVSICKNDGPSLPEASQDTQNSSHHGLLRTGTHCSEPPSKKTRGEFNSACDDKVDTNALGSGSNPWRSDETLTNSDRDGVRKQWNTDIPVNSDGPIDTHNIRKEDQTSLAENVDSLEGSKCDDSDLGKEDCKDSLVCVDFADTKNEVLLNNCNSKSVEYCSEEPVNENNFKTPLVVCNLLIEKLDSATGNQIAIEMIWVSGTGSRDLPHQIMQYLKNNL